MLKSTLSFKWENAWYWVVLISIGWNLVIFDSSGWYWVDLANHRMAYNAQAYKWDWDGWMDGIQVDECLKHLPVLKWLWFGCQFGNKRFSPKAALTADNSTPKLEIITNYLFFGALRGVQIFKREVPYFYVLSLALSGSLFVFTVYFLMQPHIRHIHTGYIWQAFLRSS